MYIIAIAWIYVTFLMALTETSVVAALLTFVFYGLGPLAIFLYVFGRSRRRVRNRSAPLVNERAHRPDGEDTQSDQ